MIPNTYHTLLVDNEKVAFRSVYTFSMLLLLLAVKERNMLSGGVTQLI